jgi:general secretion pathway protein J
MNCASFSRRHPADRLGTTPNGFTLVEVLVAMVVMAIMAAMAWQGVDGIVHARDASQAHLEQTLRLNSVIAQWDQDLLSIQDSGVLPIALACDGATVRLTRHMPDGLQVIAWSLQPEGNENTWVRWASPVVTTNSQLQESWLRSLQLQGNDPGSLRTLTGLTGWQVYFYQGNAWANCQSSGNVSTVAVAATPSVASTTAAVSTTSAAGGAAAAASVPTQVTRQALPTGVRIVLNFGPGSGISGDLTRDSLVGP